ncbi:hypothetical protein [Sporolactobacillus laevolacticus]|uniref:Uncharacterized protein n=1 Tax=Sporolactobacillus laevolacticus DSM 442 TaxID=1395513 RepID=V6J635_9BACL|nr:hypothetical protein [Sporolactobacillus laevolacticus]EST12229.1 hypothetical protein P343_08085 [Sporolactobacillus laevolacticus DSM 442]
MKRRVTIHRRIDSERKMYPVITIFEPGLNDEQVKECLPYTHQTLLIAKKKGEWKWRD